jgi:hypothetical protein
MPHTLILQMLFSRLQAARYCRSTVMFLIQRLVLRSARAHKLFRYFIRLTIHRYAKYLFSTHPLARELRYSFLLFGLETLKSSHLDAVCECMLRESLYCTAYSWFAVRPQSVYLKCQRQVLNTYGCLGGLLEPTECMLMPTSKCYLNFSAIFRLTLSGTLRISTRRSAFW